MEIVNGFICNNCTDTAYAQRHIDPAHPKDGPFGVNAPPERKAEHGPAVQLSDALAALIYAPNAVNPAANADQARNDPGQRINISV